MHTTGAYEVKQTQFSELWSHKVQACKGLKMLYNYFFSCSTHVVSKVLYGEGKYIQMCDKLQLHVCWMKC